MPTIADLQCITACCEQVAGVFSGTLWYDRDAQRSVCIFMSGTTIAPLRTMAMETTDHSISFYILWWIFQPCCTLCCNGTSTHKDTHGRLFKDSARAALFSPSFLFLLFLGGGFPQPMPNHLAFLLGSVPSDANENKTLLCMWGFIVRIWEISILHLAICLAIPIYSVWRLNVCWKWFYKPRHA